MYASTAQACRRCQQVRRRCPWTRAGSRQVAAARLTRRLGLGGGPEGLVKELVRGPYILQSANSTYQVVAEQLHDESGVLVALLGEGVELCKNIWSVLSIVRLCKYSLTSNGLVEGGLGHLAGLCRAECQDLVVEDREVQGKAETDGVGRSELSGGDLGGSLVSLEGLVGGVLALVGHGELGKVTVVVTLPVGGNTIVSLATIMKYPFRVL